MKAAVCTKYGPPEVLKIEEREKPVPKANEVLVNVIASTVHIGDTKVRRLEPGLGAVKDFFFRPIMRVMLGFFKPRKDILGMDFSGKVESVDKSVSKFKVGDEVFGTTEFKFGTNAEYFCMSEDAFLTNKPDNVSHNEAAPIANGGLTALLNLRKGNIQSGQKVLIYGASGSVGTYAVQLAKHFGANVTAVCSTSNLEMVRLLGADKVIDYTQEDFSQSKETYDLVFDAVGKIPSEKRKTTVNHSGTYVNVLSSSGKLLMNDLLFLKDLFEKGELKSMIDRCYPLEKIVEAHRYVDQGHKKGNVIITI